VAFNFIFATDMAAQQQSVRDIKVKVGFQNATLTDVFRLLESEADLNFIYDENQLDPSFRYTRPAEKASVEQILLDLSRQANLRFRQVNNSVSVLRMESTHSAPAVHVESLMQGAVVKGTVTSADDNTALPGVNIFIQNTTVGTVTGLDGQYSIEVPGPETVLVFSSVGYVDDEVIVGNRSVIDINLAPDITALDEIVVIGYGQANERDLVGAVSQLKAETIKDLPVNTFEQTLAGQVAGVQLRQTGNPGGGPEVLIRGIGSLSNNAPLYVIDGIPLSNFVNQNDNFQLNNIPIDDIESISVLKDATAKAIYGSRASNGVIIITTKRGKKGKPSVTFNTFVGVSDVLEFEKPDNLNASELAQFQKERLDDRYLFNNGWGGLEQAHYTRLQNFLAEAEDNPEMAEGTDWFDEITRQALTQNYHLSVGGGTDAVTYNLTAGYRNEEGVIIGTGFDRYTFRANLEADVANRLTMGINVAPSFVNVTGADTEPNSGGFSAYSAINAANWVDPTADVYNEQGILNPSTFGILSRQDFNGNPTNGGSGLFWTASPVAKILWREQESKTNTVNMNLFAELELIDGLAFRSTARINYIDRQTFNYTPMRIPPDGLTPDINGRANSSSGIGQDRNINLILDNQLTYNATLGERHSIDAIALVSAEKRRAESTGISANDFVDEDFIYPFFGNTDPISVNNFTGGYGIQELRRLGILGRVIYDYDQRYYFTAAFRADATSRFGSDSRWGNFPSVSAAWRVSEESFFEGLRSVISDLRFEAGYGVSGNDAGIGNYSWQGNVNPSTYIFGLNQASGYRITDLPNNALTWEETEQIDLGVDIRFLYNKFNLTVDWYKINSKGFLGRTPLPTATGFGSIIDNVGEIENQGFEFALNTLDLVSTDGGFKYDFSANLTINRNKLVSIQNEQEQPIGQAGNGTRFAILRVGDPIGIYRGFNVLGFYSEEDINNPAVAKYPEAVVGSAKLEDGNGDGVISFSEADYVDLGDPNPQFTFGMRHNFSYKNFDLSILGNGAIG
jgi:TonB-linked SusC/RagA family outer membrane protein